MCPLLKHSLGVWRAVRSQGQLEVAISRLSNCPIEFSIDNWSVMRTLVVTYIQELCAHYVLYVMLKNVSLCVWCIAGNFHGCSTP